MEIAAATRSKDPAKFVSHFPVHQDGSCNGLQHYAALGRDTAGAKSVNLFPFDRPSDVYQEVVELVRYGPRCDKTCLWGSNQPAQLQRLARKMKFHL